MEYSNLEQETQPDDKTVGVPESWPQYGIITFEGLYYTHHHTLPYVLKRLNFCIRAQEKVACHLNQAKFHRNVAWFLLYTEDTTT